MVRRLIVTLLFVFDTAKRLGEATSLHQIKMAVIFLPHLVFLTICLRFIAAQQTNGLVSIGPSFIATPNFKVWLSSSGEFAFGNNSRRIWEDYDFVDTLLPTEIMARGGLINSRMSKINLSRGRFQLSLRPERNLCENKPDTFSSKIALLKIAGYFY
ncbi:hypothetical protein LXL04_033128 [Taraxacum kok-saghyz]